MSYIYLILNLKHFTAAALHQGFATVAPPTAAPRKDPGRPERGNYSVIGSNDTTCLLAYMGLQLNITYNSVSQNKVLKYTQQMSEYF